MTIANYFTLTRLLISPLFLLIYIEYEALGLTQNILPYILLILLTVSELSDAFDGYLARKYNQVTDLGKILDPMADSIARTSMFLAFTQGPVRLPVFLIFVFLYRDCMISTLRTVCALKGYALAASRGGKIKTVMQAIAAYLILFFMIFNSLGFLSLASLQNYSFFVVGIAAIYTVYTGIEYLVLNRRFIFKLLLHA